MIKKSTLFILLAAIALGASVYYFDWKRGQKEAEKSTADTTKPAFTFPTGAEIVSLVLARPSVAGDAAIHFEKQNGTWQILQPIQTSADQKALQSIAEGIGGARIESTAPGTPDRLKVYGLDPASISIEFKLQNGSQHTLKLGNKSFTSTSVYAIVDDAKDVALLPVSLRTQVDLPIEDLRDRDVLDLTPGDVTSFSLKNSSGQIEAKREQAGWTFTKPALGNLADDTGVTLLLNALATGKMTAIISESADNLGKYGLVNPVITFTATHKNGKGDSLLIGKKDGADYFAKDSARPMIFHVNEALFKKLSVNYNDLRDKKLVHLAVADIARIELHNENGMIVITPKSEQEWSVEAPPDLKSKSVATWKILTPLTTARAEEIVDHPGAHILAKLAKPLLEATVTAKDGKNLSLSITSESGGFVYARTSDGPTVYKLRKEILNDLNSKLVDLAF
jgi:hypothetical protein